MDQHQKTIMELRIRKTMKNLERHNMQPFYAHDRAQAVEIVRSLLQKGDVVTAGGTMTMEESGLKKLLTNGDYRFLDRNRPGSRGRRLTKSIIRRFRRTLTLLLPTQ